MSSEHEEKGQTSCNLPRVLPGVETCFWWWIAELQLRTRTDCYGRSIKATEAVPPDADFSLDYLLLRAESSSVLSGPADIVL